MLPTGNDSQFFGGQVDRVLLHELVDQFRLSVKSIPDFQPDVRWQRRELLRVGKLPKHEFQLAVRIRAQGSVQLVEQLPFSE